MKVAYFTESLPPSTDGVANTLMKLVSTLEQKNIEFYFFSTFKPDDNIALTEKVFKVASFPLIFIYPHYRVGLPIFHNIDEILNNFRPDIIHAASPTPLGLKGLNYARDNGIAAVSSYHTHFVSYLKYYNLEMMENIGWNYLKWFYNQFDRTYVPSPSTEHELKLRGFIHLELWERGIDHRRFSPQFRNNELRRKIGAQNIPVLLFVGRLVKEKDLEDLVEANHILQNSGYKFKLVIVGDGHMRQQLENELRDAHFTGYLYGKELAAWYASADIFAFPSTTETFGNVVLEASASGLPIVGVNKGSVQDHIVQEQTGFISEANNPKDFATKLSYLIKNDELRQQLGDNARKFSKHYSWNSINNRLINSYQEAILEYNAN